MDSDIKEAISHIYSVLECVLEVQAKQENVIRDMAVMIQKLADSMQPPRKFEFSLQVEYTDRDPCEHQMPHTTHQNGTQ